MDSATKKKQKKTYIEWFIHLEAKMPYFTAVWPLVAIFGQTVITNGLGVLHNRIFHGLMAVHWPTGTAGPNGPQ